MTSEDLAPAADQELVCENQEKSICVKNSSAAAEAETLTVTYGKTSDELSLLGQKSQNTNDVAVEVEGDPVPLILVPAKEPAVPDHEATDNIGVPSKDLAYDEAILNNKGEKSGLGNSGLIATGITLESVLKADVSELSNEVKSSESVSDVCSSQKAKDLDFDLNEDVDDEEVDSLSSVSVEERGYMSEETQYLFGMDFYIKSSGVPKHELDLNKMPTNEDSHDLLFPDMRDPMHPTYVSNEQQPEFPLWCMDVNDDLQSLFEWINPHYDTQQGHVSNEQQHPAYPTWSSTLVYPYTDVNDDSQLSYFHPIYVSDDEEPVFPKWASLLNNSSLGVDSIISCTPNGAEPAKGRFNPNTSFMMPEDDSVESKSGEWNLKLFGQSIPVSEGPILKTGMKRKDIDCTLQLCSSDYKRYRLTL